MFVAIPQRNMTGAALDDILTDCHAITAAARGWVVTNEWGQNFEWGQILREMKTRKGQVARWSEKGKKGI